jgi:hypothetical protein
MMARGFEAWIHIQIGTLTVETGIEAPHYAPDVMRDAWTQAVRGLRETIEAAAALGLVQMVDYEDDDVTAILDDDDTDDD